MIDDDTALACRNSLNLLLFAATIAGYFGSGEGGVVEQAS